MHGVGPPCVPELSEIPHRQDGPGIDYLGELTTEFQLALRTILYCLSPWRMDLAPKINRIDAEISHSQLILRSFNALEIAYSVIEATPSRHLSLVISAASDPMSGGMQDDTLARRQGSDRDGHFITGDARGDELR
jgi:hypothetical protein